MISFRKAQKLNRKLHIALYGVSGCGKTYSALRLARGIGSKIALIDSERGSSELYAQQFNFDVLALNRFDTAAYLEGVEAAIKGEYDVLIVDSLSHEWHEMVNQASIIQEKNKKESMVAWAKVKPIHKQFINTLLGNKIHMIATMRANTQYEWQNNKPKPIGLGMVQEKETPYEFDLVFQMDRETHTAIAEKDRTGLFDNFSDLLTEQVGKRLIEWSVDGDPYLTGHELKQIRELGVELGLDASAELLQSMGYQNSSRIPKDDFLKVQQAFIEALEKKEITETTQEGISTDDNTQAITDDYPSGRELFGSGNETQRKAAVDL